MLSSRCGRFTLEKGTPVPHCVGGWVHPRADLHPVVKRKYFPLHGENSDSLDDPSVFQSSSLYNWLHTLCLFRSTVAGILGRVVGPLFPLWES
jgi:hypothetical protein